MWIAGYVFFLQKRLRTGSTLILSPHLFGACERFGPLLESERWWLTAVQGNVW